MEREHTRCGQIANGAVTITIPVTDNGHIHSNIPYEVDVAECDPAWRAVIRQIPGLVTTTINTDAIKAIAIPIARDSLITGIAEYREEVIEPCNQLLLLIQDAVAVTIDTDSIMCHIRCPFTSERSIAGIAEQNSVIDRGHGIRVTQEEEPGAIAIDTNSIHCVAVPVAHDGQIRCVAAKCCGNICRSTIVGMTEAKPPFL